LISFVNIYSFVYAFVVFTLKEICIVLNHKGIHNVLSRQNQYWDSQSKRFMTRCEESPFL